MRCCSRPPRRRSSTGDRFQLAMDRQACPRACSSTSCSTIAARSASFLAALADHVASPVGRGRTSHRAGRGRHLHVGRPGARRQGPGLCVRRCQSRSQSRTGRRRVLQLGAELLRRRAHLRARERLRPLRGRLRRARATVRPRRSARREDHARPMAATRFAEAVRKQTAEAVAKGASALIDPRRTSAHKDGTPWLAAAGADRRRSHHERDDGGELRPRRRHHEGEGRRRGDLAHERLALRPYRRVWTQDLMPPNASAHGSRPARSNATAATTSTPASPGPASRIRAAAHRFRASATRH